MMKEGNCFVRLPDLQTWGQTGPAVYCSGPEKPYGFSGGHLEEPALRLKNVHMLSNSTFNNLA